jgi:hypothetical protein
MKLQFRIFRLQYSTQGICATSGDIRTYRCALECKLDAKYSAHPFVYAMWTVVPDIYNAFTAPHIQTSIFNWTYLRCYWGYLVISMSVILQAWCQIQRTSSSLRYVNCGPGHIQCIYSSAYSDFNIQLNVSALLLEISRQFNERYTVNLVPNTAHILRLCQLWSRPYTKNLQLRTFRFQYSAEGSYLAIGGISAIQWSLYCKHGAKYSAHPPVYAMWTVVPDICIAVPARHIQASIFNWSYLLCYWR